MMRTLRLAALLVFVAACSSNKTTVVTIPAEAGATEDAGGNANAKLPDGGEPCSVTGDQDTCGQCCRDQNNDASLKYVGYVVQCFCQPSMCATQCADTFCNTKAEQDPPSGSPCDQCLTAQNEACGNQVNPQCEGDPGCLPVLQCLSDNGCQDKPQL